MKDENEINSSEKKEYDPKNRPTVIVQNLRTSASVQNAQQRIAKRLEYIQTRVSEIQTQWGDPVAPIATRSALKAEHDRYVLEVPKLKEKATKLGTLLEEIKAKEREALENVILDTIEF